ncbi:uncharacterized protein LOC122311822 [Carya illinoinensis]|uniref:uncharacterized protein LOC122311822 n=1 Tax=Carya illinoinensis TaxID=32201 RepID=UPI001C721CA2|nr:uncharacterized protein LOC122311822 [Carya illinoinensis]
MTAHKKEKCCGVQFLDKSIIFDHFPFPPGKFGVSFLSTSFRHVSYCLVVPSSSELLPARNCVVTIPVQRVMTGKSNQPPQPPPQPAAQTVPLVSVGVAESFSLDAPSAQAKMIAVIREIMTNAPQKIKTALLLLKLSLLLLPSPRAASFHSLTIYVQSLSLTLFCLLKLLAILCTLG